jgi:DNA-binding XRE family transcriptional regulator
MTQTLLARMIGISSLQISRWETGKTAPGVIPAIRSAKVLGTTVEALWRESDPSPDARPAACGRAEVRD